MKVGQKHYQTVWFENSIVHLINQNLLPYKFRILKCRNYIETSRAIESMAVRGAGAIGIAAGFAMAQAVLECPRGLSEKEFLYRIRKSRRRIEHTRPTARNLFYAVARVFSAAQAKSDRIDLARQEAVQTARQLASEDCQAAKRIGQIGERLIGRKASILTHCNAGWLAFSDWGTALAPLYAARRSGKSFFVYVDETRPRSQGARLTAWELGNEKIPHAVIADSAAGMLMRKKKVQLVIVGADRIAANGDVANKIGTYPLAVVAKENKIPFYVAAPLSTFDAAVRFGDAIPIEKRSESELFDEKWFRALRRSRVENPAFDVTPARYITGIITEKGIVRAGRTAIRKVLKA